MRNIHSPVCNVNSPVGKILPPVSKILCALLLLLVPCSGASGFHVDTELDDVRLVVEVKCELFGCAFKNSRVCVYRMIMDFIDEKKVESYDEMQTIIEEADNIVLNSLPAKSKAKYLAVYEKFVQWKTARKITQKDMCEEVMLLYMKELVEVDKLKPPTVWSRYSMLKNTLLAYENINIKPWEKVTSYMKKQAKGYCPKKASIFTADDITKFCTQAPDSSHLVEKVVLILGMAGGLRREEIYNIHTNDITESNNTLRISIPKTKNENQKSFVIMGELRDIICKYQALRPGNLTSNKFLINYQNEKCTNQVIGINKIGMMPKKIAQFLGKENAHLYSGHSFQRTSATLLVDAGADITELKRHGGWKSTVVAEGYLGDSIGNKKRTYSKITDSIKIKETKKKLKLLNRPIASTVQSSDPSAASPSSNQIPTHTDKENIEAPGQANNPCTYHISNCTVNIFYNDK